MKFQSQSTNFQSSLWDSFHADCIGRWCRYDYLSILSLRFIICGSIKLNMGKFIFQSSLWDSIILDVQTQLLKFLESFNPLFEILHARNVSPSLDSDVMNLSILSLRFTGLALLLFLLFMFVTFNPLFEIHRNNVSYTNQFDSNVLSILSLRFSSASTVGTLARKFYFQSSLWDSIPNPGTYTYRKIELLSILSLRFTQRCGDSSGARQNQLSILSLRF